VPGVQGLSVNGRVIRTGSAWASNANTLKLSGWTRFDVGARYRTQVSGKAVVLRANVENLTGKNVWLISGNNYLTLSAPRTVVLSATVDF
jgi:iron complex outermembrane receptor protein